MASDFRHTYCRAVDRWHELRGLGEPGADVERSQREIATLAFMGIALALAVEEPAPGTDPARLRGGARVWFERARRWGAVTGTAARRLAGVLAGPLAPLVERVESAGNLDEAAFDEIAATLIGPFIFAPTGTADRNPSGDRAAITPADIARAFEAATPGADRTREGMFYTPPAVVRFMVRRALAHSLHERSGISLTDLERILIDPAHLAPADRPRLMAALDGLTVLDPACGCGEFLLEAVALRLQLPCETSGAAAALAGWRAWDARETSARIARARLGLILHRHGPPCDVTEVIRIGDALLHETAAGSFDLVIGNPPYVRQEAIRATTGDAGARAHKEDLGRALEALDPSLPAIHRRADLFLYFMLHGLAALRPGGHMIFITSNAWLDVGYAAPFRSWITGNVSLLEVIEDQARKSFRSADINTVISLFARTVPSAGSVTRFVALTGAVEGIDRTPWEQVLRGGGPLRVREVTTGQLGASPAGRADSPGARPRPRVTDRWGGLHLRSPPLFEPLWERLAPRLKRLGDVAQVRFGVKTGANDFFFMPLDEVRREGLEEHFHPAMLNSRDQRRIVVHPGDFRHGILLSDRPAAELPRALRERVLEAEARRIPARRTLHGRDPWYDLGAPRPARIHCNYQIDRTMAFFLAREPHLASNNFMKIHERSNPSCLAASLNSSWTQLFVAVTGRTNFGGGLLKIETFEIADLPVIDPDLLDEATCTSLLEAGARLELGSGERRALDRYVLGACGVEPREIEELERSLADLYASRSARARGKAKPLAGVRS